MCPLVGKLSAECNIRQEEAEVSHNLINRVSIIAGFLLEVRPHIVGIMLKNGENGIFIV